MCFDGIISQLYELSAFNMMLFNSLKRAVDKLPEEAMVEFETTIEQFEKDEFVKWWKLRQRPEERRWNIIMNEI